jgi:hypothetical protein
MQRLFRCLNHEIANNGSWVSIMSTVTGLKVVNRGSWFYFQQGQEILLLSKPCKQPTTQRGPEIRGLRRETKNQQGSSTNRKDGKDISPMCLRLKFVYRPVVPSHSVITEMLGTVIH